MPEEPQKTLHMHLDLTFFAHMFVGFMAIIYDCVHLRTCLQEHYMQVKASQQKHKIQVYICIY